MTKPGLAKALARHLGAQVSVAEEVVGDTSGLMGCEAEAVANAIHKRQSEFAAGRRAARRALQHLGVSAAAIPAGSDRAPIWPDGIVGSITHDDALAVAIVAKSADVKAAGVDLTDAAPLPGRTKDTILRPEEKNLNDLDARAVFAIKECLFKALHPEVKAFFGFDAAVARPDIKGNCFTATLCADLSPYEADTIFQGTLVHHDERLAAALLLT